MSTIGSDKKFRLAEFPPPVSEMLAVTIYGYTWSVAGVIIDVTQGDVLISYNHPHYGARSSWFQRSRLQPSVNHTEADAPIMASWR